MRETHILALFSRHIIKIAMAFRENIPKVKRMLDLLILEYIT